MEDVIDPESLEAMACREGLALASDLLLRHIRLATDCLGVVRSLREEGMGPYTLFGRSKREALRSNPLSSSMKEGGPTPTHITLPRVQFTPMLEGMCGCYRRLRALCIPQTLVM